MAVRTQAQSKSEPGAIRRMPALLVLALVGALTGLLAGGAGRVVALEIDPRLHALLADHPFEQPSFYTKKLYKDVLDVDLDDPYLGLAPYVLGGEPGRHSP